jgi:hypothetical protein
MAEAGQKEGPQPGVPRPRHFRSPWPTLEAEWGAAERGRGSQEHATSPMPFASSTPNTGDVVRDVKASGKAARETPTHRQGPHEESDGAEESADGHAVHTGHDPHGAGPSPLAVCRTKVGGAPRTQRTRQHSRAQRSCMLAQGEETRMHFRGCHRNGHSCCRACAMEIDQRCCAVCGESRTHGAQGGMRQRAVMSRALSLPNSGSGSRPAFGV